MIRLGNTGKVKDDWYEEWDLGDGFFHGTH